MFVLLIGFINQLLLNQSSQCQTCLLMYQYAQFLYSQEIFGEDLKSISTLICHQTLSNNVQNICDDIIQNNMLTLYDFLVNKYTAPFFCNLTNYCTLSEFLIPPTTFKDKVSNIWGKRDEYMGSFTKAAFKTGKTIWNAAKEGLMGDPEED